MAIIVILCGAPHLYKKDMNNSGLVLINVIFQALVSGLQILTFHFPVQVYFFQM